MNRWHLGPQRLRGRLPVVSLVLGLLAAGAPAGAVYAAETSIELMYFVRSPYYVPGPQGELSGEVGAAAVRAFDAAGLPFTVTQRPPKRQLSLIRGNEGPVCGVGWFKTPERETFGRFTRPIFRDPPVVAMHRVEDTRFAKIGGLRDLLSRPGLRLGVSYGFSYGAEVDSLIAQLNPTLVTLNLEPAEMVPLLMQRRFDFMLVAGLEARDILTRGLVPPGWVTATPIVDAPSGNNRHLFCSKKVGEAAIERLNAAIAGRMK